MEKIDQVQKEIHELCKKHNVAIRYKLNFPIYNILPDEVKLSMSILEKHGMRVSLELESKE